MGVWYGSIILLKTKKISLVMTFLYLRISGIWSLCLCCCDVWGLTLIGWYIGDWLCVVGIWISGWCTGRGAGGCGGDGRPPGDSASSRWRFWIIPLLWLAGVEWWGAEHYYFEEKFEKKLVNKKFAKTKFSLPSGTPWELVKWWEALDERLGSDFWC